ncbi:hypothetical protein BHE74_00002710, partial [Ensete ventricosum]
AEAELLSLHPRRPLRIGTQTPPEYETVVCSLSLSLSLSAFVSGRPDLDSMASTAAASSTPFYANATLHAGFQDRRAKTPTAGFLHLSAKFSSGLPTSAFRVLKYPSRLRKNLGSVGKPGRTTGVAYATAATEKRLHDFTVTVGVRFLLYLAQDIDGKDVSLSKFKGKILLIVNVASRW